MFSVSVTHSKLFNGAGNKTLFASNFISYLQPNAGSQASPLQGQWRVTVAGEGPLRYQRKGLLANDTISKGKFARKKLANKTVYHRLVIDQWSSRSEVLVILPYYFGNLFVISGPQVGSCGHLAIFFWQYFYYFLAI